jgi:hypothetical protein
MIAEESEFGTESVLDIHTEENIDDLLKVYNNQS